MAEWVVLELGPKAENEDPDVIRASIRHLLRDAEIFLPVSITHRGEDRFIQYLLDGYAFIKRAHPSERYFRLEGSKFVQSIVTQTVLGTKVRKLACVQDADIDRFRAQIHVQEDQGIQVNDLVLITSGPYRNLKAKVIEDLPEEDAVQVYVQLRSKESLVTLPRAFLRLEEKAPKSPHQHRLASLQAWVAAVNHLAQWSADSKLGEVFQQWLLLERTIQTAASVRSFTENLDPSFLRSTSAKLTQVISWFDDIRSRYEQLLAFGSQFDPSALKDTHDRYVSMVRWVEETQGLATTLLSIAALPTPKLQEMYLGWLWMVDAQARHNEVLSDIDSLTQQMTMPSYQNLVIDGHNLAVRCACAPGLDGLKDHQGRPTGAITGFLNTLCALRKRFPGVTIYVTWDGSSQRRKALFEGYKQGRGNPKAVFEITWLQANLPLFGVHQAWNDVEEADDAIATLIQEKLSGSTTVILSTDRDLIQLVSETTHLLVPTVGSGKERLFTPEEVVATYGVTAEQLPYLRALSGDTSDAIPGVANCGLKTAAKLVKLYGSLDQLFRSNLAGLAKGITSNLRAAESQVRLNVQLMTLIRIPLTEVHPNKNKNEACAQLVAVDIKPDRLLAGFFGDPEGA